MHHLYHRSIVESQINKSQTLTTIGRELQVSPDSYTSNSTIFELHNCQLIVKSVGQQL